MMTESQETNPEVLLEQMGWRKIESNVSEANDAARVIEIDFGTKSVTYYTNNAAAELPPGLRVTLDSENTLKKAA